MSLVYTLEKTVQPSQKIAVDSFCGGILQAVQFHDTQLRDFLVDRGLVSRIQIDTIYPTKSITLAHALTSNGILGEDEMRRAIASFLGIPFVRLSHDNVSLEALILLPEPFSRINNVVVFRIDSEALEVAMLDIKNLSALDSLQQRLNRKILPRLTDRESMTRVLLRYQRHLKGLFGDSITNETHAIVEPENMSIEALRYASERLPVVRVVDTLIKHAIQAQATVMHIEIRGEGLLIRYRIDGNLYDAMTIPLHASTSITARIKLLAGLSLEKVTQQEGRFKVEIDGVVFAIRATSMFSINNSEKLVLHFTKVQSGKKGFTLESLGFHGEGLEKMYDLLQQKSGLIVISGAEKSGKTTILYTLLDMLSGPHRSIIAIESTVNDQLSHVTHVQVGNNINGSVGLSNVAVLRGALQQDTDIIMVDVALDTETALLAVEAANRGKLVLISIEAPTASDGIARLLELEVPKVLIAVTLRYVVCTRLLQKLCAEKDPYKLAHSEEYALEKSSNLGTVFAKLKDEGFAENGSMWKDIPFYSAKQCANCSDGYKGLIGVQEIFTNTDTIRQHILLGSNMGDIEQVAKEEGMLNLAEDSIFKSAQGITSIDEVLRQYFYAV